MQTRTRNAIFSSILLFGAMCLLSASFAQAQSTPEIHCKHFFHGHPIGTPTTNDLVIRDCYALSSNDTTKFADWVAYRLTTHEVFGTLDLEREWHSDPWLDESETLEGESNRDDYEGTGNAGYDRGHQAPLGSFRGTRYASQTNMMSNITPQRKGLNRGAWKQLEGKVRKLVGKYHTVYVMTGPLFERDMPALPNADESHTVPSGYWKIVLVQPDEVQSIRAASFIFDQDSTGSEGVLAHLSTIREVETRSGLNFLRELDNATQDQIENDTFQAWAEEHFD